MPNETIEATGGDGTRLRVEFTWRADRYGHVISLMKAAGQTVPLLESIEGSGDDAWPQSPPLQSLSIEKLAEGRSAALLVGMAGRSHWSASIEPALGVSGFVFDVACRHSQAPNWLGSRYRRLSAAAADVSIRGDGAEVVSEDEIVAIQPKMIASGAGTTRWKYRFVMPPLDDCRAPAVATEQQQ